MSPITQKKVRVVLCIALLLSRVLFLDHNGWGLWLAATKYISHGNVAVSSLFSENMLEPIHVDECGRLEQSGNISQERGPSPK